MIILKLIIKKSYEKNLRKIKRILISFPNEIDIDRSFQLKEDRKTLFQLLLPLISVTVQGRRRTPQPRYFLSTVSPSFSLSLSH
jgi:hypothetical protein